MEEHPCRDQAHSPRARGVADAARGTERRATKRSRPCRVRTGVPPPQRRLSDTISRADAPSCGLHPLDGAGGNGPAMGPFVSHAIRTTSRLTGRRCGARRSRPARSSSMPRRPASPRRCRSISPTGLLSSTTGPSPAVAISCSEISTVRIVSGSGTSSPASRSLMSSCETTRCRCVSPPSSASTGGLLARRRRNCRRASSRRRSSPAASRCSSRSSTHRSIAPARRPPRTISPAATSIRG